MGIDVDESALAVYRANHDHPAVHLDLGDVGAACRLIGNVDLLAGSPPCTDFSSAGSRVEGENAGLTVAFARLAVSLRVRCVLLENVTELLRSSAWAEARGVLVGAGYSLLVLRVNSAACGVPQIRRRIFVIATLGCAESTIMHVKRETAEYNHTPVNAPTVRSCLDSPSSSYWLPCRNSACVRNAGLPAPTLLCKCLQRPPDSYVRRHDDVGPVCNAHVLSVDEMARVASFPDHYFDCTSRASAGIFIGNCVPPRVAETVGRWCMELLRSPVIAVPKPVYFHSDRRPVNRTSRLQRLVDNGLLKMGGELSDGVLRYVGGASADGDSLVQSLLGRVESGWRLEIKPRRTPTVSGGQAPKDDLFVFVPGFDEPFRSFLQLQRSVSQNGNAAITTNAGRAAKL